MAKNKPKIIVVGGGLAGLFAAAKAAENGAEVLVFSLVSVKRSHSNCAQGGVNAAMDTKGEGDSTWEHFDDTVYGGDFLAHQPPVKELCETAPSIIELFDRMGVVFSRTAEGNLDLRLFGGVKKRRTVFAGGTTGQQMLYGADELVRSHEAEGRVKKYEYWQFLSPVVDPGTGNCCGITALNLVTGKVEGFTADAVIMATGGVSRVYGRSTGSVIVNGSAASACYQHGAVYANGEFIQIHPTAIPGDDKNRLMSEASRGEGGRIWTYKDGKPWYFLEEWYPAYGNTVPRDIATRAIHKVCVEMGLGLDGKNLVHLDLTHLDPDFLETRLGGILEIYQKFTGDDPKKVPMKIFPSIHYSMGGLWVDYDLMTNIPGLFAGGECNYAYHGANRLGANSLLSASYDGLLSGRKALEWAAGDNGPSAEKAESLLKEACRKEDETIKKLVNSTGKETPHDIHYELGEVMTANVHVIRENARLKETDTKIQELIGRFGESKLNDSTAHANMEIGHAIDVGNMLHLARVITLGALNRNESRGAHYKAEYPDRDDKKWMVTTKATFDGKDPVFDYSEKIDVSLIKPRLRDYSKVSKAEKKKEPASGKAGTDKPSAGGAGAKKRAPRKKRDTDKKE